MNKERIIELTNQALIEEFELELEDLNPQAHIRDDLGLDSLDIVDMTIVIEKAFNTKLTNKAELASIQTLGDIYDYLEKLQEQMGESKE